MSFHPPTPPSPSKNDSDSQAPKYILGPKRDDWDVYADFTGRAMRPRLEWARTDPRPVPGSTSDLEALPSLLRRYRYIQPTLPAQGSIPHQRVRRNGAQRGGISATPRPIFSQPPQLRQQLSSARSRMPRADTPPGRLEPKIARAAPNTEASQPNGSHVDTMNVLNDFDTSSWLDDQLDQLPSMTPLDRAASGSDSDSDIECIGDRALSTFRRKDDGTSRAFPPSKGIVREGIGSKIKHNAPLLLHSTISEDYSDKETVKRKLFCAMEKTFAPHPFKAGLNRTQVMPASKSARPD